MSIIEQRSKPLSSRYSPSSATALVDNKMVRGTNGVAKVVLPEVSNLILCCEAVMNQ